MFYDTKASRWCFVPYSIYRVWNLSVTVKRKKKWSHSSEIYISSTDELEDKAYFIFTLCYWGKCVLCVSKRKSPTIACVTARGISSPSLIWCRCCLSLDLHWSSAGSEWTGSPALTLFLRMWRVQAGTNKRSVSLHCEIVMSAQCQLVNEASALTKCDVIG